MDEWRKRKNNNKTKRKRLQDNETAEDDLRYYPGKTGVPAAKEIYVQASKLDHSIGMATVYRLVKELRRSGT